MRNVTWLVVAVLLAATAGPVLAADAAKGQQLYAAQKCSLCHSIAGKGNPKGPLEGVGKKLTADELQQWLTAPDKMAAKAKAERKPPMKSYASLSKTDLADLVAYLQTLK